MRTLHLFPPNYAAINAAFNVRGKPVVFAYGDTIYNPSRTKIAPSLKVHEQVHGRQQLALPGGPAEWWKRYIADKDFRLEQEIPAHQAEFANLCAAGLDNDIALGKLAKRLSSPLYGSLIGFGAARRAIAQGRPTETGTM